MFWQGGGRKRLMKYNVQKMMASTPVSVEFGSVGTTDDELLVIYYNRKDTTAKTPDEEPVKKN